MKFLIYSEKNVKKLANTKSLLMKILPDAEIKTVGGKDYKSEKMKEGGLLPVKLEDFLSGSDKETAVKFCELVNVGVSNRVLESL